MTMIKGEQFQEQLITFSQTVNYVKTRCDVENIGQPLPIRLARALEELYDEEIPLPVQLTIGEPEPDTMSEENDSVLARRYPQMIPVLNVGRDVTVKAPHIDRLLELPFDAAALVAQHLSENTSSSSAAYLGGDDGWTTSLKRAVERTWYGRVLDAIMHLLSAANVMSQFEEVTSRGPDFDIQKTLDASWQAYRALYSLQQYMDAWALSTHHLNNIENMGTSCDLAIVMKVAPYLRRHIGTFVPVNLQYFIRTLLGGKHADRLIRRRIEFGHLTTTKGETTFEIKGRGLVLASSVLLDMTDMRAINPVQAINNYIFLISQLDPFTISGNRLKTIQEFSQTLFNDFYKGLKLPQYYFAEQHNGLVFDPLLGAAHEITVLGLLASSYKTASAQENVGVAIANRLGLASAQAAEVGAAYHAMYHLALYPVALTTTYRKLLDATLRELDPWLLDLVREPIDNIRDAVLESIHNRPAYGETFESLQAAIPETVRKLWDNIQPYEKKHTLVNRRALGHTTISMYVGPGGIKVYNSAALSLAKVKATRLMHKEIVFNTVLEALQEVTNNTKAALYVDLTVRRLPISGHPEIIRLLSCVDAIVKEEQDFTYYAEDLLGGGPTLLFFPDLNALARHLGYENWDKVRELVSPSVFDQMTNVAKTLVGVPVHELRPQLIESRTILWKPEDWFGERLLIESIEDDYSRLALKQKVYLVNRMGEPTLHDIPYPFYVANGLLKQRASVIVEIERPPKTTKYAADVRPDLVTLVSRPESSEPMETPEVLDPLPTQKEGGDSEQATNDEA